MEPSLATICDNCGKQFSNVYTLNAHTRQVHNNEKPYKCEICSLAFSTKYKLNRHTQGIHSETRDKFCEICGLAFKTREMLIKHHRTHFKGPFMCDICQEVFKYKASFDYHFKIKHEIKEIIELKSIPKVKHFECKICSKVYKNFKSLQNHEECHVKGDESRFKRNKQSVNEHLICFVCHKGFDHKKDFEKHLTTHEEEYRLDDMIVVELSSDELIPYDFSIEQTGEIIKDEAINCNDPIKREFPIVIKSYIQNDEDIDSKSDCMKIVNSQSFISYESANSNHKKQTSKNIHNRSLEKIICDICGVFFMNKSHLRRHHLRKHQNKSFYKYECDVCSSKFLIRYDLQRHMIKHKSNRDVECSQCNKKFKTKSSLDCHIKFMHVQDRNQMEKQFVCNICSRAYYHRRHLEYHMRKHTDDRRYSCDKCDKSFLYSDAVKWHQIRSHKEPAPFICNLCSRKFIHEKTYESHLKDHDTATGSLTVKCPVCYKRISEKRHLPRHIRTHLKKGFTCDYCNESFKERFQLTKHLLQCEDKHNKDVEVIYEAIIE